MFRTCEHAGPRPRLNPLVCFGVACSFLFPAHAVAVAVEPMSLREACSFAVQYDAQLRSAEADQMIAREEVSKAVSAFMPTLRGSASTGRNRTGSTTAASGYNEQYYNTLSSALSLKQPILNIGSFAALGQARAAAAKSESLLAYEHSNLIVRTAEAFFNVLFAEDNLAFTHAQTRASVEQLQQAKRRYAAGFGTVTEINEAQASYDMAIAEEASAISGLDFSRRELERITGIYTETLSRLSPPKLALKVPEPRSPEGWLAIAEEKSPRLQAYRQEIEIARREIDRNRASRYPQVDLWAGRSYSESETDYAIGSTYDTWSISLHVNVPIYTGGYTSASIRQAAARHMKAYDELDLQERAMISDIRKYYNAQVNSIAQVKAYEQAVRSSEVALEGTKKGFMAGFRTNADVLDAQKKLLESRRHLAKSRYLYIMNGILLKDSAGVLSAEDIEEVDNCLETPGS